ncbi:MAG: hybrid sensor histidine kinase/response regulator [Salinarimonadaceae bacterium]|nr:MAG: hybrid sensor histidine kinase/response regulator [Salinarimonadaceae bacterium]
MLLGRSNDGYIYLFTDPVRVLAVDDDPIMREFAVAQLSHPGGEIVTAFDGQDAWQKLQSDERGFDLVISDLEMPRMTGFNLCEEIRADARFRDLPVVVITGRDDTFAIDRAYEVGATSFVAKPVNWRLLGYQLRYVLRACRTEHGGSSAPPSAIAAPPAQAAPHDLLPALSREAYKHIAAIEHAARGLNGPSAEDLLETVEELARMLKRATSIADVAAGAIAETSEEISLAGLLNERARTAESAASARNVAIALERPPALWRIEGDRRLLTQALDLLIGKMAASADEGSTLRVSAAAASEAADGRAGFEIIMSAQGRPLPEDLDGALLLRIVEAHAGELTIRRTAAAETQAHLVLPAARPTKQPIAKLTIAGFA